MRDLMQEGMSEALRLTREGRLSEATAMIQSSLGEKSFSSMGGAAGFEEPIETTFRIVEEASPQSGDVPRRDSAGRGRRAEGLARGYRSGLGATVGAPDHGVSSSGGRFIERSYANRAGERAYKLYVPSGYVGQATPLVVMLHGCTQTPEDLASGTRMNELAEEQTFLVAYPAQVASANSSRCWNWFQAADQRREEGEPSIIAGITRQILDDYSVDAGRVYIAGMSAGGAMAAIMGATHPELYGAIGVHSGLAPGAARDLPSAFSAMRGSEAAPRRGNQAVVGGSSRIAPMIVFHGDRDKTVHPRNAERLISHWTSAADSQEAVTSSALHTVEEQGKATDGHSYTRAVYQYSDGRALIERWTVHGLAHAWSGGSSSGSYTDSRGPDASAQMVRFFNQHQQS